MVFSRFNLRPVTLFAGLPTSIGLFCWASIRVVLLTAVAAASEDSTDRLDLREVEFFESAVRPILVERCYSCHSTGAKAVRGGLRLDTAAGWREGGDSGPAIEPGAPEGSLLVEAIEYRGLEMPPTGKLPDQEISVLKEWIRRGAPDPRRAPAHNPQTESTSSEQHRRDVKSHWAYQPIRSVSPPKVSGTWPRTAVDQFILAQLNDAGLKPAADADPATLLRRLYFDLIGLPPPLERLQAFSADPSPEAVAGVVDELLASPAFGEKWGRHWLDVARYADTNGLDENFTFYDAWHYRNYVIRAWNADRPFDRFITEQVAGDLLTAEDREERDENLTATGYLVLGPKVIGATDKTQLELDVIDEQIDTLGRSLLGLTLGCARCHDHKFDPIPTRDYYALAGIFASTETLHGNLLNRKDLTGWNLHAIGPDGPARYAAYQAHERKLLALKDRLAKRKKEQEPAGKTKTAERDAEIAELERELKALQQNPPDRPPLVMSVGDQEKPGPTRIRVRGIADRMGDVVPRGFISVVGASEPQIPSRESGRRELAAWLTSPDNPLTSRVAVNRVWHQLFGSGLVRTVDNFGVQGESPSHPLLLDYLARRFVREGWSTKRLIRLLVLSRVYQQASNNKANERQADPENRLLSRMNRRRLPVESLRDALLSISGQLDRTPTESVVEGLKFQATGVGIDPREPVISYRRSIYLPVVRNDLHELFQVFDFADPQRVTGRRNSTTVAPQSLYFLNSPRVMAAAEQIAKNLGAAEEERLDAVFRVILSRPPRKDESRAARSFLAEGARDASPMERWSLLCHGLICSTHFQFLD